MIKKSYISLIGLLIIALCTSCDFDLDSKDKEPEVNIKLNQGGFEGIIRLVEKNNSQKTDITFSISKDKIKREQIYSKGKSSQEIVGIIIEP